MGFIKILKDMFNKNIECGDELDNHIVFFMKKKKYLYLNKNIYVRNQSACVVVYDGKICDVILEGKYKINQDSIPETYSRAKIERKTSQGKSIKKIKVNLYFVNLRTIKHFEYISDSPFKSKTSSFGRVKGKLAGVCNLKILDPGSLLKFLLSRNVKLTTKEVNENIEILVGNKINSIIQKQKVSIEMLLSNQEHVESIVNTEMEDALDKQGLIVSNVKLKAIDFSKKNKKKVNRYLTKRPTTIKPIDVNTPQFGVSREVGVKVVVNTNTKKINTNSTMQNNQKSSNIQAFIECKKCHKKNGTNARICINCGHKLG